MRRPQLVIFGFAFLVCVVRGFAAASYEYGSVADLKGLTIYFVDSGADINTRNEIAAKIAQENTTLRLADARDQAGISVDVTGNDADDGGAAFLVYVAGKDGRARLIQKFSYTHSKFPRARPTSRFARDFAKLWRDAQMTK